MTWIRIDDQFAEHPKIVGLSDGAFRVLVASFCYCGRWNTDGRVPKGAISVPARYLRELIGKGRWHEHGHDCETCPPVEPGAHYVHDFLVYNPSSEEVDEAQGRRSERARRAARARWDKSPPPDAQSTAPSMPGAMPEELPGGCLADAPVPYPVDNPLIQPVPEPPAAEPVDDDEALAGTQPIDLAAIKRRAVLERVVDHRMNGKQPRNRAAYRASVFADVIAELGDRITRTIDQHPDAPVDVLAGYLDGERNGETLARYRRADA